MLILPGVERANAGSDEIVRHARIKAEERQAGDAATSFWAAIRTVPPATACEKAHFI
jgi:P pilus assembly chaperone PapD